MAALAELRAKQCRYPKGEAPFDFCAAPTDGRSYCPEHDALCHCGPGSAWQALAGMMQAYEHTIDVRRAPADVRVPVDEGLKIAAIKKGRV